jgi:hypothetical protein
MDTPRIKQIMQTVAEFYDINPGLITAKTRFIKYARARQVAIYMTHKLTNRSHTEIGKAFNRDHSTVIHAIKKIRRLILSDTNICNDIDDLTRILEPQTNQPDIIKLLTRRMALLESTLAEIKEAIPDIKRFNEICSRIGRKNG